jgi:hypothetical protein
MGRPRTSERLRLGESSAMIWSAGRGERVVRKTYLYTRHEWEEAPVVHRPVVLRAQVSEDGTAYRLIGWDGERRGTGDPGAPWRRLSMVPMLPCKEPIHNRFVPTILRSDRRRQSVTRRTSGYDQSAPSVGRRQRLWAIEEESFHKRTGAKAVQGFFFFR